MFDHLVKIVVILRAFKDRHYFSCCFASVNRVQPSDRGVRSRWQPGMRADPSSCLSRTTGYESRKHTYVREVLLRPRRRKTLQNSVPHLVNQVE